MRRSTRRSRTRSRAARSPTSAASIRITRNTCSSARADAVAPRVLHPCFYGCFDWHSAVHTHWLLVRLLNTVADFDLRVEVLNALSTTFAPAKVRSEARYLAKHRSFERPYGLAWLVLLGAEVAACARAGRARAGRARLRRCSPPRAPMCLRGSACSVTPCARARTTRLRLRSGCCTTPRRTTNDARLRGAVRRAAIRFFRADEDAPLSYEPSGEDFLSPALMEADLMRRVLGNGLEFAQWLAPISTGDPERAARAGCDRRGGGRARRQARAPARSQSVARVEPRERRGRAAGRGSARRACSGPRRAATPEPASRRRSRRATTRAITGCRRSRSTC